MNKFLKVVGVLTLAIIAGGVVSGLYDTATNKYEPTEQAITNTRENAEKSQARKEFVEGCTLEGGLDSWCVCTYNALDRYYNGRFHKESLEHDRILKDGYNEAETSAVLESCPIEQPETQGV